MGYSFLSKAPAAPDVVASFLLQGFFDMSRCREMYSGRFCGWLLGRRHCQSVVFQEQAALAIRESSKSSLSSMRFVAPPIFSFPAYLPRAERVERVADHSVWIAAIEVLDCAKMAICTIGGPDVFRNPATRTMD